MQLHPYFISGYSWVLINNFNNLEMYFVINVKPIDEKANNII